MAEERRMIAIDADFFRAFTEDSRNEDLFLQVMDEFHAIPVMHEYVYRYELADISVLKKWVAEGIVRIIEYDDFITEKNREKYKDDFTKTYKAFNYLAFDETFDVFQYHHMQENLGEIRTILMAVRMNIGVFMSNDKEAKRFIINRINHGKVQITVYNLKDTFAWIGRQEGKNLRWKNIKGFCRGKLREKEFEYLRNNWAEKAC